MSLLADIESRWLYDRRKSIRWTFKAGQLAAFCGHDRLECPFAGNVGRRRTPRGAKFASDSRKAWLEGFDLQKKAMEDAR